MSIDPYFFGDPQFDSMARLSSSDEADCCTVQEDARILASKQMLVSAVGEENLKFVRNVEDPYIDRIALYGTILIEDANTYFEIFKRLHPSSIWLQDDSKKVGTPVDGVLNKIKENGSRALVGPYLLWAQSRGRIFCAYPSGQNTFTIERFLIPVDEKITCIGFSTIVTCSELRQKVSQHLKKQHRMEWWNKLSKIAPDSGLGFLPKILDEIENLQKEILDRASELERIPRMPSYNGKRTKIAQAKSKLGISVQEHERSYKEELKRLNYTINEGEEDPSGLRQWRAFAKVEGAKDNKEIREEYAKAFDALV